MTEEEALLSALLAAATLDDDTLHRITLAVLEDLIERGELDAKKAGDRSVPR